MNAGKQFEKDIQKSCKKQEIFFLRLQDAGGWSNADNTRFTPKNLCDCIMHYKGLTLLVELKSHLGKSIPISALKQYEKMNEIEFNGVLPLFFLNFRELEETYILEACQVALCLRYRKSVDIGFCRKQGTLIKAKKLIKNYEYNLLKSFEILC
jgi:penicillin-binding protein-related factor A (putative recombinase)